MADLESLGLQAEEAVEVDWSAPEAGQFPPKLWPGDYPLTFNLDTQSPFGAVERTVDDSGAKQKFLEVTWTGKIGKAVAGLGVVDQENAPEEIELRFLRTNFYKHPKMQISDGDDLIRHLGQRLEGAVTNAARAQALEIADGRAMVMTEIGWSRYCKPCSDAGRDAVVTTYKRKGATMWPRDGQGKLELVAACPGCGQKGYGREEARRFKKQD